MSVYEQLKSFCDQKKQPFKLLIICPDRVRRYRALQQILISLGSKNLIRLTPSDLNSEAVSRLKDFSLNLSLFEDLKTYVFKDLNNLSAGVSADLTEIFCNKKQINNYIGLSEEPKAWFNKAFKKQEILIFEKLESEALLKWTQSELKRVGLGRTNQKIAEKIVTIGSDDCDHIEGIIEKLSLMTDNDSIELSDLKHFELFIEKTQEFHFINLLALARKTEALACLSAFESSSSSAFPLLSLTSKMIFNYTGLKISQINRMPTDQLIKALALSPWALKKQNETATKADLLKLTRCIQALARADSQLKNKNLGEQQILIEMIANV